ncbi:MAG: DPP IV N-terminal domain-containing protein [Planctomycetota bacterium]
MVFPFTFAFGVLCVTAAGQPVPDNDWQEAARDRLEAIYSRGEFRARPDRREWLADSSAFVVQERDPVTKQLNDFQYDVKSGERTAGTRPASSDRLRSPNGKRRLVRKGRGVFVVDLNSGQETKLVESDPDRDIHFGKLLWSPNGEYVSLVEFDRTDVRYRTVLVPEDPSYPGTTQRRFARVGETIEAIRVGIIDISSNELRWLPIESAEDGFYLGEVDWVPNSDQLLVETLSRFRDQREFLVAGPDGEIKRIFLEVNDAWAVGSQGLNSGVQWLQDGSAFIFISEKDGWRQAYLLSIIDEKVTPLMKGEYDIIERAFVDEQAGCYYFYASPDNGTQRYLYRVPLDGSGELFRISPDDQPGTHRYQPSPDRKWAIHTYSTVNDPPNLDIVALPSHETVRILEDNNRLRIKANRLSKRPIEFVQVDIGDDVVLDASLIKPSDFDESKKYPIFVYVYGEPYSQTVLDDWGAAQSDFHQLVADLGYVVISIDNRGTPSPKGAAWRRSVFGSLGPLSTEDQAAALKKLAEMHPFLDLSRVGIWGWSGGGSNTLNAMFRKPDLYHVGIAVVPKPQPWLYNAWFQEIYMRTREVNADGYEQSAPINFAEGLKGKLLMVTGSGETNTHIQIIEGLVDRLIELGKSFDYMVYPNRDHGLREGPGTVIHVRMLILRYLVDNLPRGPR